MRSFWFIASQFLANALAIKAADFFIPGVAFQGDLLSLTRTAAIITALHVFLKPIAKLFLGPFIVLSFGLVAILLNGVLLWLATYWAPELQIATFWDLLLTTLLFSVINVFFWLSQKLA